MNLNPNLITDNRKFWKHVKPFFSDKPPFNNNITLLEVEDIVSDNTACAEIFNTFFSNSVQNLDIDRNLFVDNGTILADPANNIIETFKDHPSVVSINQKGFIRNSFSFQNVVDDDVFEIIDNLNTSKAYQKNNIPPKLLKDNADVCASVICNDINSNIERGCYPVNLKNADITPTFKKAYRLIKINYRPVSILPQRFMKRSCICKFMNTLVFNTAYHLC